VVRGLDRAAEGFEPSMVQHERLRVYVLRGRHTVLAWCRDSKNTWESELKNGVKPEVLKGVTVDLSAALKGHPGRRVRVYDPWADKWSDGKVRNGQIALPEFSRSIVVKVE
jgi:hypothetical protein